MSGPAPKNSAQLLVGALYNPKDSTQGWMIVQGQVTRHRRTVRRAQMSALDGMRVAHVRFVA